MTLYRCAACGSANVVTDQENDGIKYDYVKGAIGTVVLGAGGAVAGISNKSKMVFKCRDCGVSLSYSLGEPYKSLIDTGVASMQGRQTLNINGFPISWETIQGKFPNIERGPADSEIELQAANRSRNKKAAVEYLMTLWQKDNADDMEFLKKDEAELDAAEAEWEREKQALEAKKNEHLNNAIAEIENEIKLLEEKKRAELAALQEKIDAEEAEIKKLQEELASLGVFKFSEKSNLKKLISDRNTSINNIKDEASKKEAEYSRNIENKQQSLNTTRREMTAKLNIIYAPAESPKERFARLKDEQGGLIIKRFPMKSYYVYIRRYYPHLLSYYGKACEKELEDVFEAFFLEMTQQPSVYMGGTSVSRARHYYAPFLTETMEGAVHDRIGTITKMGTMYYEYKGI